MNDLLSNSFESSQNQSWRGRDIEMAQVPPHNNADMGLESFFAKVREIEKLIEKLSELLQKLQEANENSKTATKASTMKGINVSMKNNMDEVGITARNAKSMIEELDRDNVSNRRKPGCEKGTGVDRSRTSTTQALRTRLKNKLDEFQMLRELLHKDYRATTERRIFTVTGVKPEEEVVDRLVETGNAEQIFQKAIREQGRGQLTDTLAEINERHDAVKDLERKLLNLQQMFMDMAVLVDSQGDMLDNIESQVTSAVDHVQSGTTMLHSAKRYQKSSRKWMCIAILILLVVIVIVVVGVIKPWSKGSA